MTLDEAIKHCLEQAEENEKRADKCLFLYGEDNSEGNSIIEACRECATEHRQLAEWLTELTAYRKLEICDNCKHYVSGTRHFGECHATSDIEPTIVCVNECCETFRYKDFSMRRIEDDTL